jgi:pSer/pThr/pTyr-binding forkhead associated (FHA) protein
MPTLTLKFKNDAIALFHLEQGRSLKIGRKDDNDVVINNLAVSGYHAKIDSVGEEYVFVDLQSKNGSFINEKLVNSHWLKDGDVISIGKHALLFAYTDEEALPDTHPTEMDKTMVMDTNDYRSMMQKSKPTKTPESAKSKQHKRGFLKYLSGGEGLVRLRSKQTKIGKDASSDIIVKGLTIGKTSAIIERTREGYVLSYVGGLAKPKVNDQKVTDEPVILQESDIIDIGSAKFQFVMKKVKIKAH